MVPFGAQIGVHRACCSVRQQRRSMRRFSTASRTETAFTLIHQAAEMIVTQAALSKLARHASPASQIQTGQAPGWQAGNSGQHYVNSFTVLECFDTAQDAMCRHTSAGCFA